MAFRDLMQSHASMVFATARRITRDALYRKRTGSFGGLVTLDTLLGNDPKEQPFWWCRPEVPWEELDVKRRQGGEAE